MPLVEAIENNLGRKPEQASADSGYCSEPNLKALVARGIDGYVAPGRAQHPTAAKRKELSGPLTQLMRTKIDDGGFETPYRLRKQVVEPVFGQIQTGTRLPPVSVARRQESTCRVGHDLHHPQSPWKTFHHSQRPPESAATAQQMPGRDAYLDGLLAAARRCWCSHCLTRTLGSGANGALALSSMRRSCRVPRRRSRLLRKPAKATRLAASALSATHRLPGCERSSFDCRCGARSSGGGQHSHGHIGPMPMGP